MSWQLTNFVAPMAEPLENLQNQFTQLALLHRETHTYLRSQRDSLTASEGVQAFMGEGATAFSQCIEYYIAISEKHMQGLDEVASMTCNCVSEILNATGATSYVYLDDGMVEHVLSRLTHESVIQEGGNAVMVIINDMRCTLDDMINTGGSFFGHLLHGQFGDAIHDVGQEWSDAKRLASDALYLLEEVGRVLFQWAQSICEAVSKLSHLIIDIVLKIEALVVYIPYYIGYRTQSSIGPYLPNEVNLVWTGVNAFWLGLDVDIDKLKRANGSEESDYDERMNGSYFLFRIKGLSAHPGDPFYGYLPGLSQDKDCTIHADLWPYNSYPWSEGFGPKGDNNEPPPKGVKCE
jgi:hypothetical protein